MVETTIRILQPGDETALEAFLLPRIASSMFLIGNTRAAGLEDRGQPYQGTYAAAFAEGVIVGVVAHYWNQNLVFQAPLGARELSRRAVEASGRPIGGLIGPRAQVDAVKEILKIQEPRIQLDETEKLYALDLDELIVPDPLRSGEVIGRQAEPRDLERLVAWRVAYESETLGEEETPKSRARIKSTVHRLVRQKHTWVLEIDGTPVACTSFNAATREAVQVGGVWTPPKLRSRGYGRAVVAGSLLDARAEGVRTAVLFTGQDNVPAQRAYQALGFQHIGSYRILLLRTPIPAQAARL